jgi:hypothetical protein
LNAEPPLKPILIVAGSVVAVSAAFVFIQLGQAAGAAAAVACIAVPLIYEKLRKQRGVKTGETKWKKPESWDDNPYSKPVEAPPSQPKGHESSSSLAYFLFGFHRLAVGTDELVIT